MTSTAWVACGELPDQTARTPPHGSSPSVSCSGKIHRLPASRTASSRARPDRDVVGLVEVRAAERLAEVDRHRDVRTVLAHDRGDRTPQLDAVLQDAVGQSQELDLVDAHHARRRDLLAPRAAVRSRRGGSRRCPPPRWSPCSRRCACPARSSAPPRRRRRTRCRRGGRPRTARSPSPRGGARRREGWPAGPSWSEHGTGAHCREEVPTPQAITPTAVGAKPGNTWPTETPNRRVTTSVSTLR